VTNATAHTLQTVARTTLAQEREEHRYPLHLAWPADMYSLSHVAVPFPLSDSLYGREPDEKNRYGISLGTISLRGNRNAERGAGDVNARHLQSFLSVDAGARR
jgi:hypothetical protein